MGIGFPRESMPVLHPPGKCRYSAYTTVQAILPMLPQNAGYRMHTNILQILHNLHCQHDLPLLAFQLLRFCTLWLASPLCPLRTLLTCRCSLLLRGTLSFRFQAVTVLVFTLPSLYLCTNILMASNRSSSSSFMISISGYAICNSLIPGSFRG